jgi:hypothetical protein
MVMGDADGSYDFTGLDPFVEKLRAGYELVTNSDRDNGNIRREVLT